MYPEERSSCKDERRSKVPWTATWTGVKQTLLPDVGNLIDKRVKRGLVGRCYLVFFRVLFLFLFSDRMPDFVRFYLRLIWVGNKIANIKKRNKDRAREGWKEGKREGHVTWMEYYWVIFRLHQRNERSAFKSAKLSSISVCSLYVFVLLSSRSVAERKLKLTIVWEL